VFSITSQAHFTLQNNPDTAQFRRAFYGRLIKWDVKTAPAEGQAFTLKTDLEGVARSRVRTQKKPPGHDSVRLSYATAGFPVPPMQS